MDLTDLKILRLLQEDGRVSMSQLAKEVHLSAPSVAERVRKLESSGVITQYKAMVDPAKLNRGIKVFYFIKVPPEKRDALIQTLLEAPDFFSVDIVSGNYTAIACAYTHDLEKVLEIAKLIQKYGSTESAISLSSPVKNKLITDYFENDGS